MLLSGFRSSSRFLSTLAVLASFSIAARADDVVLVNGNVFEDVIVTERTAERVRLQLSYGELSLPASQVDRIIESRSPLEIFLERRRALEADEGPAEDWLALAEWAELRDLDYGYQEVVEIVAKRAPRLPGLAPHMRSLGYELDGGVGAWVRPRPKPRPLFVRDPEAPPAPQQVAREGRQEAVVSERLSRAVEMMAEADLARANHKTHAPAPPTPPLFIRTLPVWPAVAWTGWSFPNTPTSAPPPPADPNPAYPVVRRPTNSTARALLRRQPGSIIPLSTLAR